MSKLSISVIEARSGIDQQSGETVSEYLRRVGEQTTLSSSEIEAVVDHYRRQAFAPNAASPAIDDVPLDEFSRAIEELSEDSTADGRSEHEQSEATGEVGTNGGTPNRTRNVTEETSPASAVNTETSAKRGSIRSSDLSLVSESRDVDSPVELGSYSATWLGKTQSIPTGRLLNDVDPWWYTSIALIGAYIFVQSLGNHPPLYTWDEAIYANVARHMVQDGYWLIPHLHWLSYNPDVHLQPFLEKPPLVFWLQAISMSIFGVTRFAARLPSALFAILSGLLIYRFGTHLFDRTTGLSAAVVLFTTPMIYAGGHGGRTGSTDVPLMFFGTLFVYLTWRVLVDERQDLFPYVGVAAGLALLTKGFNAGVFVIAVAPLALYHFRAFLSKQAAAMIGVTAGIALPWPLYAWSRHGHEFINYFFLRQVLARATGEKFTQDSGTLFPFMRYRYFQNFPAHFDPWFIFLLPAVGITVVHGWRDRSLSKPLFLVWWAASTFGFFVLTGNHGWYIMPMFVPSALLIGQSISLAADRSSLALAGIGLSVVLMIFVGGVGLEVLTITLCFVAVVGRESIVEAVDMRVTGEDYRILQPVAPVVVAFVVVVALVGTVPLGVGDPEYSGEERLGQTVAQEVPEDETVALGPSVHEPRALFVFAFYAQRSLDTKTIDELNRESDIQYALILNQTRDDLERNHSVLDDWRDFRVIEFTE